MKDGLSLSGSDVKNFLLNSLTSESFRCASSSGKRKEKLHSRIEKVLWSLGCSSLGLPKLRPDPFPLYPHEMETAGYWETWTGEKCFLFILLPSNAVPSHIYTLSSLDFSSPISFHPLSLLSCHFPRSLTLNFPILYQIQSKEDVVHIFQPNPLLSLSKMTSNGPYLCILTFYTTDSPPSWMLISFVSGTPESPTFSPYSSDHSVSFSWLVLPFSSPNTHPRTLNPLNIPSSLLVLNTMWMLATTHHQ